MKKILLLCMLFVGINLMSQETFQWDIRGETSKDKSQLYSDVKMFIAEYWKSAQNVIQNDDKEQGLIVLKGLDRENLVFQLNDHIWTYVYTIKFYVKDNKYRIVIDNVYCESARCGGYNWPLMPVADKYPENNGFRMTGINEKRYDILMTSLKANLQSIVDSYQKYMLKESPTTEDW